MANCQASPIIGNVGKIGNKRLQKVQGTVGEPLPLLYLPHLAKHHGKAAVAIAELLSIFRDLGELGNECFLNSRGATIGALRAGMFSQLFKDVARVSFRVRRRAPCFQIVALSRANS